MMVHLHGKLAEGNSIKSFPETGSMFVCHNVKLFLACEFALYSMESA